ncbi:hypothetical protein [Actinomadura kijaniata]|uniref:hypothetical protein n=1 Tax=Actinomadura kijaniata TaxID=46161 RepID=UPI0012FA9035|nr:hypothetical protein [Actinomadura kijaniata]
MDAGDLRQVIAAVRQRRATLNTVTAPSLSLGNLWVLHALIDPGAKVPVITGIIAFDRG